MKEILEYKGYSGTLEFSLEDKVYYGKLLYIKDLVAYECRTKEGLEKEFKLAVENSLE